MSAEVNKAVVRRYIEEAFNQGNLDMVDEVIATDSTIMQTCGTNPYAVPSNEGKPSLVGGRPSQIFI